MINKLIEKIQKTQAPIVVGLDPMMKYVPSQIQKAAFAEFGETLEGAAEAIWQYNKGIVDAIYDLVPAVKPQIAMYEQFGIPGLVAFKKTVDYCKEKGLIVIDKEDLEMDADDLMMLAIDAGAEDFSDEEDSYEIITAPEDFDAVLQEIQKNELPIISADVTMIPQTWVELTDEADIKNINRILDFLDEDDDVQNVYHNWDE